MSTATTHMTDLARPEDDVVLAELVEHDDDLALAEARAITDEAREALWHAAAAIERAGELVARAWDARAHEVLLDAETGQPYGTWKRYVAVELLGLRSLKIAVEDRLQLVSTLIDRGVSRRGVAEAIGVSEGLVRLDLKKREQRERPVVEAAPVPAAIEAAPVSSDDASAPQPRTRVELVLEEVYGAGHRGRTGPEVDEALGFRRGIAGAILSEVHKGLRVQRLSVQEPTGTRLIDDQPFAVYVAHTHEAGRATEGPGRRSRRRAL